MKHPYKEIGDYARWDRGVADLKPRNVDPVVSFPIRITQEQRIVTAGSCFAQHIARYLQESGFNYFVTEPGHPLLDDQTRKDFNYGVFSARYGNLYTSRQLVQLFRRAYGELVPEDDVWDAFIDPYRPAIQPGGFPTRREYDLDREQHFAAVRRAFEELDVLVFTFGLTETWTSRSDGAAFPLAPGVAGGTFDPDRYVFVNLGVADVVAEMTEFIDALRRVNPSSQVILTVSPVPLFATAVDRHVLVSTTYSKSVLRVAAETLTQDLEGVHYFPSYEIVTGNFSRGTYFADDLRSIRERGVEHVMSLFFEHATEAPEPGEEPEPRPSSEQQRATAAARKFDEEMEQLVNVLCDEELIGAAENGARPTRAARKGRAKKGTKRVGTKAARSARRRAKS